MKIDFFKLLEYINFILINLKKFLPPNKKRNEALCYFVIKLVVRCADLFIQLMSDNITINYDEKFILF